MAARARLAAAGALEMAARALLGAAGALEMAARARLGAAWALERAARALLVAAGALEMAARARLGAAGALEIAAQAALLAGALYSALESAAFRNTARDCCKAAHTLKKAGALMTLESAIEIDVSSSLSRFRRTLFYFLRFAFARAWICTGSH